MFYGILPGAASDDDEEDIESSIQKEIDSIANKKGPAKLFKPVYLDLQCVLFFKTIPPVVPVEFVHRICEDARNNPQKRQTRFVNRLTPMTRMGKATEKGLEEVGKVVIGEHFHLAGSSEANVQPFSVSTISSGLCLFRASMIFWMPISQSFWPKGVHTLSSLLAPGFRRHNSLTQVFWSINCEVLRDLLSFDMHRASVLTFAIVCNSTNDSKSQHP